MFNLHFPSPFTVSSLHSKFCLGRSLWYWLVTLVGWSKRSFMIYFKSKSKTLSSCIKIFPSPELFGSGFSSVKTKIRSTVEQFVFKKLKKKDKSFPFSADSSLLVCLSCSTWSCLAWVASPPVLGWWEHSVLSPGLPGRPSLYRTPSDPFGKTWHYSCHQFSIINTVIYVSPHSNFLCWGFLNAFVGDCLDVVGRRIEADSFLHLSPVWGNLWTSEKWRLLFLNE